MSNIEFASEMLPREVWWCKSCGAVVMVKALHEKWHAEQDSTPIRRYA